MKLLCGLIIVVLICGTTIHLSQPGGFGALFKRLESLMTTGSQADKPANFDVNAVLDSETGETLLQTQVVLEQQVESILANASAPEISAVAPETQPEAQAVAVEQIAIPRSGFFKFAEVVGIIVLALIALIIAFIITSCILGAIFGTSMRSGFDSLNAISGFGAHLLDLFGIKKLPDTAPVAALYYD